MADIVKYKFYKTEVSILPTFNEGFEYNYTDVNENSVIVRTITSDSNPSSISFKDKNIIKIESLNLTNVEELDIDTLDLNAIVNAASLISNCATLKSLRAKANVVNELIPHLQTKTNLNSGTIKASDASSFINNNELNIKNWYIDEYRHVDLFVMMGEAHMKGQSEETEVFEVPVYKSYDYINNTNELVQVKNPFHENAGTGFEGAVNASLQPYFADEYFNKVKVPTLLVNCACSGTDISKWLPGDADGRHELSVNKINNAMTKVQADIDRPIRNKYLIWFQGETDAVNGTTTEDYKTRFLQLWNGLKTSCGLEKCFIIRSAKTVEGAKLIIDAQEQLAQENDDIIMATRATGLLEDPNNYTLADYKSLGATLADRMAEFEKTGLRPVEDEPYVGEITSSNEMLIASYKYSGTSSLIPTFDKTFDYRIVDSKDASGYTDRRIISSYIPTKISFQQKTALRQVKYLHTSKMSTAYGMFYKCTNLTYVNMPYVSYVTTMEGMFNGCSKLQRIEGIEKWNTARNSNWGSTFGSNSALTNLDPRNFILTDAHAFGATFRGCYASPDENFDFSNWKTPNLQYMSGSFDSLKVKELNLSSFNVSSVSTFQSLFNNCTNLERLDLSNWIMTPTHYNWQGPEASECTTLAVSGMFNGCSSLVDIKLLNTNRFTAYKIADVLPTRTADKPSTIHLSMDVELDTELSDLITSKGWTIDYKKQPYEYEIASYYFNPEIGNILPVFNDGFEYTYTDSTGLNDNILRTIKSTELPTSMHFGITHVSQNDADSLLNVLQINTSNISDLSNMFKGCRGLELIPIGVVTSKATKLASMFEGCSSLNLNFLYQWYTENVTDMSYIFKDCTGMTSIGIEELNINENTNIKGMFEGCISLRTVRATPEVFDKVASVLPDRPFDEPGQLEFRTGTVNTGSEEDLTCDAELLKHNWLTDRNRHLDLFVMMGQSNMQGQSEMYKEFEVPMYQSCTYLYNKDELAQVKHPFGENIQTLGTYDELGYYQLEGAVGCDTGLPYGSLSPHFAASYYEQTKTPTLMVQCARGATTMKDWLPGTTQQRFEIAVEKTQKSIAAVEDIGRTIRGKYLVWLQGESDGAGTSAGTKKTTYKTRFLQFWNAIKEQLGFEKCFIIRVHKFRDGYKYNCFPIIEAQEELALENDDIEMVTRVTGYLQYYDENPEHYTIQHAYQGLQIIANHDHYTWEGYKLVGDTAGSRVGQYINTGIMPALEEEPWPDQIVASASYHVATYKFDNTIYANYVPEFNEGYQYRVIDTVEGNITTRQIIGVGLPTLMRFGAYYTYDELNGSECNATERELCLKEIVFADTSAVTDATNMFCFNSNLTSLPAIVIKNCSSLYAMFYECTSLTNIDARNFDLSKTTDIEKFVYHCSNLVSINIEGWDTSNVISMYGMFMNSESLTDIVGIENLNVEDVKTMTSIFEGCHAIKNLDLSNWNVEKATTIVGMFRNCNALETLDLSNWHLVNCKNYNQALQGCDILTNVTMKYSDYNTINNIVTQLPSKTVDAPGTLLINNVDVYKEVDLEAATAKYWNTSYKFETENFNSKIVCLGQLERALSGIIGLHDQDINDVRGAAYEAINAILDLDSEMDERLDSKSFRFVTQEEYDNLSEEDLNEENIVWCIEDELGSSFIQDVLTKEIEELNTSNKTVASSINELDDKIPKLISEEVIFEVTKEELEAAWNANQNFDDSSTYIELPSIIPQDVNDVNEYNYRVFVNNKEYLPNYVSNYTENEVTCWAAEFYRVNDEENNIMGGYYSTHLDINWDFSATSSLLKIDRLDESKPPIFTSNLKLIRRIISRLDNKYLEDDLKVNDSISLSESDALGKGSTAFGVGAKATAYGSQAEGLFTEARATAAHAEGQHTKALGKFSHSENNRTIASGESSHAEGEGTIAAGKHQHAQGKYNIEDTENKYAHIVGNGLYEGLRSNAHTLDWDGNAWFQGNVLGTNLPYDTREIVEVASSYDFVGTTEGKEIVSAVYTSDYNEVSDVTFVKVSDEISIDFKNPKEYLLVEYTWFEDDGENRVYEGSGNSSQLFDTTNENIKYIDQIYFVFEDTAMVDTHYAPNSISLSKGIWHTIKSKRDTVQINYDKNYKVVAVKDGEFNTIDAKFVPLKPGLVVEGQSFDYTLLDGTEYTGKKAYKGAEVFNNIEKNVAADSYSHAEGDRTVAGSNATHAEGRQTYALGECAHAEGYQTMATQFAAHAEGKLTVAGLYGHAEGVETITSGYAAHAEGCGTIANGKYQHAQGKYNAPLGNNYAHVVGNGSSDTDRKNAHTLDWDGNAWFQGNVSIDGIPTNDNDLVTKQYVDDNIKTPCDCEWVTICENVSSESMERSKYVFPNIKIEPHTHIELALDVTDINGTNRIIEFLEGEIKFDFYDSQIQKICMSAYSYDDNYDLTKDAVDLEVCCFDEKDIKIIIYAQDTEWEDLTINKIVYLRQLQSKNKITDLEIDEISYFKITNQPSWMSFYDEGMVDILRSNYVEALINRSHSPVKPNRDNVVSPFTDTITAGVNDGFSGPMNSNIISIRNAIYSNDARNAVGFSFVAEKTSAYSSIRVFAENAIVTITDGAGEILEENKNKKVLLKNIPCSLIKGNTYYVLFSNEDGSDIDVPKTLPFIVSYNEGRNDLTKIMYMDNTFSYTPTEDYHPATKKYVDDNKFSKDYNDLINKPDLTKINALQLNGYSLWVGTTDELNGIEERDENTIYFEINNAEDSESSIDADEIITNIFGPDYIN